MVYRGLFFVFLILVVGVSTSVTQNKSISIGFYNVENLFDTINDPHRNDNEFLPESAKKWSLERYNEKLINISRVILSMNNWEGPDILGLCEVENRKVLEDLIQNTALKTRGYQIIHRNSPDPRGIDVAMVYKPKVVQLLAYKYIPLLKNNSVIRTREVLLASVKYRKDTLHLFVNHWSSRRGGEKQSEHKRLNASSFVLNAVDSLRMLSHNPKIIVMGDFNDDPENKSILHLMAAGFVNVSQRPKGSIGGSLKYQGKWNLFDQILISSALIQNCKKGCFEKESFQVLDKEWLLVEDERYAGEEPKRTYKGKKYMGGYSDHLPVSIKINK